MMINELFDLEHTIAKKIFDGKEYGFEVLPLIKEYIITLGNTLNSDFEKKEDNIWIHKTVTISDKATIKGPCIIDENTEIRTGAFIRGSVIVGKNCVIGNSSELKNSIIFDNTQIPHFNYVGDSVLGYHSHLGAGVILSNIKNDKKNIIIRGTNDIETNLRKMGALVGDYVEVGCNSVLNPGTIVGRNVSIYPLTFVRGIIQENSIVKDKDTIVKKEER